MSIEVTQDGKAIKLDSVERAIADIRAGKAVVVVDDEDRENEGDLVFAAEKATPELVAFMVRYTSGYICAPMLPEDLNQLGLPPMAAVNEDVRGTAYTVTVDFNDGTTGISAASRAKTLRALASTDAHRGQFTRPGHVVPLSARPNGVLDRNGHTEASVDLARLAGLRPAGVICEIVSEKDPTDMARLPELREFADTHDLALISIEQMIQWRRRNEMQVVREVATSLPTDAGPMTALGYRHQVDGTEHVALIAGSVDELHNATDVPVRVHSECLTGDVFHSRRCDCGQQLDQAVDYIQRAGSGVVIYIRGHEGRGIGLLAKLKAYRLQESGADTVDANLEQGLPADAREFSVAGQILADLGIASANLLTNNPFKAEALEGFGVEVSKRTALLTEANEDNIAYLRTKRDRMGHDLPTVADWDVQRPQ
ncbi:bifunctional 3,4-dihydroxy-2-butanone-4-phosphate synthase/GTP cyclohydrolase II [Corynebacterium pseudodiphtheriticum]|uniref:bifunctional 3,4-dihydroxy-2-butanone-4-phosphate synthase/GTP cyclohydrolase II n=1 Tax=Corynebacterium pseudodiphtheriticum TaxID=37637 RepID=UPI0021B0406A|nr:bifunctional 3,4-dihydroxy-2-butanone-4-phosphate synthase/GTP cyclohydrolase II [Corynebacterium pseudodiphtheriticum]MCT1634554.1 bifunctional 3,4-dihydroxy-2-butanone-4-phosphate synthase/GTP cyclohydrolase II [Corynebacterium pseudodiphtheriticum]MCT1665649.1 bifunctional 3,4-dihydroxy-2-butanone-4-phosphate synthase/GTP cyclohydrolase II [Corynebacterium pseudodiphtheriticum]WKS30468.1 bifunctional 3,4-dihydroxy-2-butanone-4-phosphate synthase/GTP cyclohydrolase II [Corynebacterium pseud